VIIVYDQYWEMAVICAGVRALREAEPMPPVLLLMALWILEAELPRLAEP
jgi:hypothetical protein